MNRFLSPRLIPKRAVASLVCHRRPLSITRPSSNVSETKSLASAEPKLPASISSAQPTSLTSGPHEDLPLPYLNEGGMSSSKKVIVNDLVYMSKASFALASVIVILGGMGFVGFRYYIESVRMKAPASLFEVDQTVSEAATWGWELENDDWTGGLAGGTSSVLPGEARRSLRAAYSIMNLGLGIEEERLKTAEEEYNQTQVGNSFTSNIKGMIQIDKELAARRPSSTSFLNQGENAMAEAHILMAIAKSREVEGVWYPPPLDPTLDFPSVTLSSPRAPKPENSIGLVLLLRHANILERAATDHTLRAAREMYERVLRSVNGVQGAETLEAQLARKIGDLGKMVGDPQAKMWVCWGLQRLVSYQPPISSAFVEKLAAPPTSISSPSWWSKTKRAPSSASQETSLSAVSEEPSVEDVLAQASSASLPPSRVRALLALLTSLSSLQSQPSTLAEAQQTQTAALSYINSHLATPSSNIPNASFSYPPEQVHTLTLQLYQALFSVHLAEVLYASRPKSSTPETQQTHLETSLTWLNAAFLKASSISSILTAPPRSRLPTHLPFPPPPPGGLPDEPSFQYNDPAVLGPPSKALLLSARKVAGSAANLLGVLTLRQTGDKSANSLSEAKGYFKAAMTYEGRAPPEDESEIGVGGKEVMSEKDEVGVWGRYYRSWQVVREMEKGAGEFVAPGPVA